MKRFVFLVLFTMGITYPIKAKPMESTLQYSIQDIFESLKSKIKKYQLENGLRIIVMQNGSTPTVALYWKILAGSSDEVPENAGIAHMLEHMLFKGTKVVGTINFEKENKYLYVIDRWYHKLDQLVLKKENISDPKQLSQIERKIRILKRRIQILETEVQKYRISEEDSIIYSIQGQRGYNAYTSEDVTNYQIELPSNRIEVWARLESDRIQNSVFREFYTERNVVAEERRMRIENNPFGYMYEKFLSEVYKDHPYGLSTIGPMKNILTFKKEDAEQFYQNYYRPDNTVISIVGKFDEQKVLNLIQKYFGNWKKPSKPIPRNQVKPIQFHKVDLKIHKDGSPIQILAWLKPRFPAKEDLSFEILADILTERQDSILIQKLIKKQKYASKISIYTTEPGERYDNLFLILIYPNLSLLKDSSDHFELQSLYTKIQNSILEELHEIETNGIEEEELNRVKQSMLTNFIKKLRSNSYLAENLSYYELMFHNYNIVFDLYQQLLHISSQDIQDAIRKYLNPQYIYKAELYPIQSKGEKK